MKKVPVEEDSCNSFWALMQGFSQPGIHGVITPVSRILIPVSHVFLAIYKGYFTPFITIGSGPTL